MALPTGGSFILEAVVDVPSGTTVTMFSIDGAQESIKMQFKDNGLGLHQLQVSAGSLSVTRTLAASARGYAHVLCASRSGSSVGLEQLQCFLNGQRFDLAPSGGSFSDNGDSVNVTVNVPYVSVAVWGGAALNSVASADDLLARQDQIEQLARQRLALWSGVPVDADHLPLPGASPDDDLALTLDLGGESVFVAGSSTPVVWLLPGFPRVVADGDQAALLLEGTRANSLGAFDVLGFVVALGCPAALGPSGDAQDAVQCDALINKDLTVPVGTSERELSVVVHLDSSGEVDFSDCQFTETSASHGDCIVLPLGGGWTRVAAPVPSGVNKMNVSIKNAALAYPQLDDKFLTTPMSPGSAALADVVVYPIAQPVPFSGLELAAVLDGDLPSDDGATAAIATLVTDEAPAQFAQLFVDNADIGMIASGASLSAHGYQAGATFDGTVNATASASCVGPSCIALPVTATLPLSSAALIVVGGDLASTAGIGGAVLLRSLTAGVVSGSAPPLAPDFHAAYGTAGVPPSPAALGVPVVTFDDVDFAHSDPVWTKTGGGTPGVTDAPALPSARPAFLSKAAVPSLEASEVSLGGNDDPIVLDALFEITTSADAQRVFALKQRNLAIEVPLVSTGAIQLSDRGVQWSVAPAAAGSVTDFASGWLYLACASAPPAAPVCQVNMAPADVEPKDGTLAINALAEVGADSGSLPDNGGVAFVHIWEAGGLDAAQTPALLAQMAESFFGVAATTGQSAVFSRASAATVQVPASAHTFFDVLDVGPGWPRLGRLSSAAAPGYVSEGVAENVVRNSTDPGRSSWTTVLVSEPGNTNGPRKGGEIAVIETGGSLTETFDAATTVSQLFGAVSDSNASTPVTFSAYLSGGTPTMSISAGGVTSRASPTQGVCNAVDSGVTCAVVSVDSGADWQRVAMTVTVPKGAANIAIEIDCGLGATVKATAPMFELGSTATSYIPT
ncbi:MAG TPA: hypothetical protein VGO62_04960, partial [Myxococcota bacterium]